MENGLEKSPPRMYISYIHQMTWKSIHRCWAARPNFSTTPSRYAEWHRPPKEIGGTQSARAYIQPNITRSIVPTTPASSNPSHTKPNTGQRSLPPPLEGGPLLAQRLPRRRLFAPRHPPGPGHAGRAGEGGGGWTVDHLTFLGVAACDCLTVTNQPTNQPTQYDEYLIEVKRTDPRTHTHIHTQIHIHIHTTIHTHHQQQPRPNTVCGVFARGETVGGGGGAGGADGPEEEGGRSGAILCGVG